MEIYYIDYLHREITLHEKDIQIIPESGRADEACDAIAKKSYVQEQLRDVPYRKLKEVVQKLCDNPDIQNRHDALMYIVWMAALDIKERRSECHEEPVTKTCADGFVWLLADPDQARRLWKIKVFSLYRLYTDDSEAEIESDEDLEETIERGYQIGIEVGFISNLTTSVLL